MLTNEEKCECCGKETKIIYDGPFHSVGDESKFCPECIASGKAADQFHGEFQDCDSVEKIDNPEALEELCKRTPAFASWQQGEWLSHCDDFCDFIGLVDWSLVKLLGKEVEKQIIEEYMDTFGIDDDEMQELIEELKDGSFVQGYLFRCLTCGKYRFYTDCD